MKSVPAIVLAALLVLAAARARADSPSDYLGPRELALGESMRAEAIGASAITLNPAALGLTRELVFDGFYGYRGGAGNTHLASVSGCDSTVPVPGCFYYRYLRSDSDEGGSDPVRAHEFGATVARGFSDRIFLGVTSRYFDYEGQSGDPDDKGFGVDAGVLVRVIDAVGVAVVGYNLVSASSAQYPRSIGAGVVLRPFPSLAIGADGLWRIEGASDDGNGRYGGGVEYFLSTSNGQLGYPFRAGVVHDVAGDVTHVTGGVGIATSKLGLDLGVRKEIDGDGFAVLAGLRVFGPRLARGPATF